jgi:Flp pilus assembly protein TadG
MKFGRGGAWRSERGSAIIEMAATLPILALLVLGIGRLGVTFNNFIALTDAVRNGSRQLTTGRGVSNPCQSARNRVYAAAPTLSQAQMSLTMTLNGGTVANNSCSNTALTAGQDATVAATYPCDIAFFGIDFAPNCTLTASTTGRIE